MRDGVQAVFDYRKELLEQQTIPTLAGHPRLTHPPGTLKMSCSPARPMAEWAWVFHPAAGSRGRAWLCWGEGGGCEECPKHFGP